MVQEGNKRKRGYVNLEIFSYFYCKREHKAELTVDTCSLPSFEDLEESGKDFALHYLFLR